MREIGLENISRPGYFTLRNPLKFHHYFAFAIFNLTPLFYRLKPAMPTVIQSTVYCSNIELIVNVSTRQSVICSVCLGGLGIIC